MVPAQVGNAELFRELLEDVTWAQMVVTGQVTAAGRAGMRALTFNHVFEELADTIEYQETNTFTDADMSVLERVRVRHRSPHVVPTRRHACDPEGLSG